MFCLHAGPEVDHLLELLRVVAFVVEQDEAEGERAVHVHPDGERTTVQFLPAHLRQVLGHRDAFGLRVGRVAAEVERGVDREDPAVRVRESVRVDAGAVVLGVAGSRNRRRSSQPSGDGEM